MEIKDTLEQSINGAFIKASDTKEDKLKPSLIINDPEKRTKALDAIINALEDCDEFLFSVAFLTDSGFAPFLNTFDKLRAKGVKGKIVVSQYNNFTQPTALEKLLKYEGSIDLRIVKTDVASMHTKGYIFRKGDLYTVIIGSSNLTENALVKNKEWNVKLNSLSEGSYTKQVLEEFNKLYEIATPVTPEFIDEYTKIYRQLRKAQREAQILIDGLQQVKPNAMQIEALRNLKESRELGNNKGLLISATGTGKTYLSAFDAKAFKPKKFLFVVHREKIAKDAMKTYKKVFGQNLDAGLMTAGNRSDAHFVFAMVQTLSKERILNSYSPDEFDYIVFDECHRMKLSGDPEKAAMYQRIYDYFTPKFMLGMTATPERTDGADIYKFFNHNIVYEIRLQDAMEADLVCPFHYYGISDFTVNGKTIDDKSEFNRLIDDDRVKYVIEQAEHFGYCGDRVKGLIFVSRVEEAKELSERFNKKGYRTVALAGCTNEGERENAIQRLEQDEYEGGLDYIFTVDIFNEGVDIPQINQVIMLRPTESSVIFIQQLGRGLRKAEGKEYVNVIDFIGNYENNFLIPMALKGNRNYNKDDIRIFVVRPKLPGISTISFSDDVSKRIIETLDRTKFSVSKIIVDSYKNLKNKLNKIPSIRDFAEHDAIDIMRVVLKYKSYYQFLVEKEKDFTIRLNEQETAIINYVSSKFLCGKRPHELLMLKTILHNEGDFLKEFETVFKKDYSDLVLNENTKNCLLNQMLLEKRWGNEFKDAQIIEKRGGGYFVSEGFLKAKNNKSFVDMLDEILDYGLERYKKLYSNCYKHSNFKLYQKYTYEDVCRGLDWDSNQVSLNIGGYKYDKTTNTFPIFINYEKKEIAESINYHDRFINNSKLIAISKGGRSLESPDIKTIADSEKNETNIMLFMRKNKDDGESKEFYFLGAVKPNGFFEEIKREEANDTVVEIGYDFETPVNEDIYKYIIG